MLQQLERLPSYNAPASAPRKTHEKPRQHARLLACGTGCVSAQQPPSPPAQTPTFRTGVDAVQLDVSVLDKDRRPVRGLTAADFTVLDNGKPRQIVTFSAVELPVLPAPAFDAAQRVEAIASDVTSNDLPDGRLVVILIDPFLERVMVPGRRGIADPPGITAMRATAARVVDSLGPGDVAAVAHTFYGVPQNFTADKARLKRAIDTSVFGTQIRAEGQDVGDCNCGTCRAQAITRIARALRGRAAAAKDAVLHRRAHPARSGARSLQCLPRTGDQRDGERNAARQRDGARHRPECARDDERACRRQLHARGRLGGGRRARNGRIATS